MDDLLQPLISVVPEKWRTTLALAIPVSMVLGRVIQAIRTQGGLKAILSSIWLGTNGPKAPPTEPPKV